MTGYAKDYIGQLAREGKVPATRVGRAWYVDESAIRSHSGVAALEEPERETPVEPKPEQEKLIEIKREDPHFLTARQTAALYSLQHLRLASARPNSFKTWSPLAYSHDEEALLPQVKKPAETHQVPVHVISHSIPQKTITSNTTVSAIHNGVRIQKKSRIAEMDSVSANNSLPSLPISALPTTLGTLSVLLIVAGAISLSGIYAPAEWNYSVERFSQTASVGSVEFIRDYFMTVFNQGIALIGEFLDALFASAGDFFKAGFDFILVLLNI